MSSRAFSVSYPRRTADSKLARTTWPEVLRPRAIMRPRDWARQRALLRILRKSFFHTNWNFIFLEYFFDFSASFMANFPYFQLFKHFRYTLLILKVVCSWGRGLWSLASGVKRWLRGQHCRISQPGLIWVPYITLLRSLPSPDTDLSAGSWKTSFKKKSNFVDTTIPSTAASKPPSYRPMYLLNKKKNNLGFWETAHLPLP